MNQKTECYKQILHFTRCANGTYPQKWYAQLLSCFYIKAYTFGRSPSVSSEPPQSARPGRGLNV